MPLSNVTEAQQPPAAPKQAPQTPANKPAAQPQPGPAVQSTHFPILLLVQGPDQSWDLRIGQRGPERLDRTNYPPIPLEAGEVSREGGTDSWTYHAKDMQTGATISARLTRQPCSPAPPADPNAKWVFTATVEDSQIGTLQGCGRIATELFPKIKNQLTPDDDDAKPKTPPPTITKFKSPVSVSYLTAADKILVKRGALAKAVPGKIGADLCLSHDGRKLLFTRTEPPAQAIYEYDLASGQTKQFLAANASQPFWSPDDSQIAFLESVNGKSQLWLAPADAPDKAAAVSQSDATTLDGWADPHTLLVSDLQTLSWVGTDGTVKQTVSSADLYGKDLFKLSSASSVRVHPENPDLLLVSAETAAPLPTPVTINDIAAMQDATKPPQKKEEGHAAQALFLYEVKSRRRVLLSPQNLTATLPEWSPDGLQIFFTGRTGSGAPTIFRLFWDGTGLTKVHDGSDFVIGD